MASVDCTNRAQLDPSSNSASQTDMDTIGCFPAFHVTGVFPTITRLQPKLLPPCGAYDASLYPDRSTLNPALCPEAWTPNVAVVAVVAPISAEAVVAVVAPISAEAVVAVVAPISAEAVVAVVAPISVEAVAAVVASVSAEASTFNFKPAVAFR